MDKSNYTSLELSKWLHKNKCELESDIYWYKNFSGNQWELQKGKYYKESDGYQFPAYDILNDICLKYALSFFDKSKVERCAKIILKLLQVNEKQEAELYIRENCLFNPNNK